MDDIDDFKFEEGDLVLVPHSREDMKISTQRPGLHGRVCRVTERTPGGNVRVVAVDEALDNNFANIFDPDDLVAVLSSKIWDVRDAIEQYRRP